MSTVAVSGAITMEAMAGGPICRSSVQASPNATPAMNSRRREVMLLKFHDAPAVGPALQGGVERQGLRDARSVVHILEHAAHVRLGDVAVRLDMTHLQVSLEAGDTLEEVLQVAERLGTEARRDPLHCIQITGLKRFGVGRNGGFDLRPRVRGSGRRRLSLRGGLGWSGCGRR